MKLKLDENVHRRVARELLALGHDTTTVYQQGLSGRPDVEIAAAVVEGDQKRSWLFLNLLRALLRRYRRARVLHLILDNYTIHTSRIVKAALAEWGGRLRLHFLPGRKPHRNPVPGEPTLLGESTLCIMFQNH